jgi:hypothetical protein
MPRTFFTPEERLLQTLNTFKTIRDKIPNSIIILLEGSNISTEVMYTLYKYVDRLILYSYDPKIHFYVNNPNKSFGEVYMLLEIANKLQNYDFNKIFKITGRYYLNENFNINNFSDEFISGKIVNHEDFQKEKDRFAEQARELNREIIKKSHFTERDRLLSEILLKQQNYQIDKLNEAFITSLYSVPKKELIEYKNLLELFIVNNFQWVDIEHHIHSFYKNIKNIDTVGVEGVYAYGGKCMW